MMHLFRSCPSLVLAKLTKGAAPYDICHKAATVRSAPPRARHETETPVPCHAGVQPRYLKGRCGAKEHQARFNIPRPTRAAGASCLVDGSTNSKNREFAPGRWLYASPTCASHCERDRADANFGVNGRALLSDYAELDQATIASEESFRFE